MRKAGKKEDKKRKRDDDSSSKGTPKAKKQKNNALSHLLSHFTDDKQKENPLFLYKDKYFIWGPTAGRMLNYSGVAYTASFKSAYISRFGPADIIRPLRKELKTLCRKEKISCLPAKMIYPLDNVLLMVEKKCATDSAKMKRKILEKAIIIDASGMKIEESDEVVDDEVELIQTTSASNQAASEDSAPTSQVIALEEDEPQVELSAVALKKSKALLAKICHTLRTCPVFTNSTDSTIYLSESSISCLFNPNAVPEEDMVIDYMEALPKASAKILQVEQPVEGEDVMKLRTFVPLKTVLDLINELTGLYFYEADVQSAIQEKRKIVHYLKHSPRRQVRRSYDESGDDDIQDEDYKENPRKLRARQQKSTVSAAPPLEALESEAVSQITSKPQGLSVQTNNSTSSQDYIDKIIEGVSDSVVYLYQGNYYLDTHLLSDVFGYTGVSKSSNTLVYLRSKGLVSVSPRISETYIKLEQEAIEKLKSNNKLKVLHLVSVSVVLKAIEMRTNKQMNPDLLLAYLKTQKVADLSSIITK